MQLHRLRTFPRADLSRRVTPEGHAARHQRGRSHHARSESLRDHESNCPALFFHGSVSLGARYTARLHKWSLIARRVPIK